MIRHKTLRGAYQDGVQDLSDCGIEDASVDAWLLLAYVTGITRTYFLAEGGSLLTGEQQEQYAELISRRGRHIPLQHLTGEQEFMGLSFLVNEHVLIPRQDTEILVEETLGRLGSGMRVLDLCTGSGCIAISLKKLGEDLQVDAADISGEALAVAAENAKRLDVEVRLIQSDLFENISEQYDVIVSNPPYIRTDVIETLSEEVRLHEPYGALDGRDDGLYFYRRIIRESRTYLNQNGWLLFEIGYDQADEVTALMSGNGFSDVTVVRDLAGLDRVVLGRFDGK